MKRLIGEAFVELSSAEVERFHNDKEFQKDVISAADEVASLSGRTVIVSGPDYELGKFFSVRGFEATEHRLAADGACMHPNFDPVVEVFCPDCGEPVKRPAAKA